MGRLSIVPPRYLEHLYTNDQEETREVLANMTRCSGPGVLCFHWHLHDVPGTGATRYIKAQHGEVLVLLETDLGVEANMAYYQVLARPPATRPLLQAGDMPFNFGLARNLGPNLTAGEVKEEVGGGGGKP